MCSDCTGIECSCNCKNEPHHYGAMRVLLFCSTCDHIINEKEVGA